MMGLESLQGLMKSGAMEPSAKNAWTGGGAHIGSQSKPVPAYTAVRLDIGIRSNDVTTSSTHLSEEEEAD